MRGKGLQGFLSALLLESLFRNTTSRHSFYFHNGTSMARHFSPFWEEVGNDENIELIIGSPFIGTEVRIYKNDSLIRRSLLTQEVSAGTASAILVKLLLVL